MCFEEDGTSCGPIVENFNANIAQQEGISRSLFLDLGGKPSSRSYVEFVDVIVENKIGETIFSLMEMRVSIESVNSATYGAKAKRPFYSVLENKHAKEIGLSPFSHWKDALATYLNKKGYIS